MDPFSEFEHEGWQRVARKYEDAWSSLTRAFVPPLLDAARVTSGTRLLDVACGPGYVSESACERGAQPIGIDFCAEMVSLAKRRNPQIGFHEGDAQALSFADDSFDAVVMNFGLLHLSKPEAAFSEGFRVLRPGGYSAFTVWAGPELSEGAKLVEEAIKAYADMEVDLPSGPNYFAYSNPNQCRTAIVAAGFDLNSFSFETVTTEWQVPTASFIFESERYAGVRTAALLARQTDAVLAAIQQRIEASVLRLRSGDGYAVPFAAHIVAARKPT